MIDKADKVPTAVTTAIVAIKGFAKYLIIPTGAIMFAPDDWLLRFRLLNVKNSLGVWVAILFWISASITIIDRLEILMKRFADMYKKKQFKKALEQSLEDLNLEEWDIIYRIYRNNSYEFDFKQASVAKLTGQNIILRPSTGTIFGFSYTLQPWVRTYLKKNPELIVDFMQKKHQAILNEIIRLEKQTNREFDNRWEIDRNIEKLKEDLKDYE